MRSGCVWPPGGKPLSGLIEVLEATTRSRHDSFLSRMLKKISAPRTACYRSRCPATRSRSDFAKTDGMLDFLDTLDAMVLKRGGRVYLAKERAHVARDVPRDLCRIWAIGRRRRVHQCAESIFVELVAQALGCVQRGLARALVSRDLSSDPSPSRRRGREGGVREPPEMNRLLILDALLIRCRAHSHCGSAADGAQLSLAARNTDEARRVAEDVTLAPG